MQSVRSLYESYKKHYGKDGDKTLIWQSNSQLMNPTLNQEAIERAKAEDPEGSVAEWDGMFRSDIESFVSREAVDLNVLYSEDLKSRQFQM